LGSKAAALDGPISVVVTVRNDRDGLLELIPALASQTRPPEEVVIVDGGSDDGTAELLAGLQLAGSELRYAVEPSANIAAGRNAAVRLARHDRIAVTDAGCRPDPGWLDALGRALDSADLVGGIFITDWATTFEQVMALTHYPVEAELDSPNGLVRLSHRIFGRHYLPYRGGGRSMAFTREAWATVGGFPEFVYAGEEQAFARAISDRGFRTALEPEAKVYWRPPGTWSSTARMFYRYCRGDVRSKGRSRHFARLAAWTAAPVLMVRGGWAVRTLVGVGAVAYLALPLERAAQAGVSPASWWRIPVAVGVKDLAQLAGAARGTVDALMGVPQPTPGPR
jgi:glycosyltransferase involved in cell wall biosynthesis